MLSVATGLKISMITKENACPPDASEDDDCRMLPVFLTPCVELFHNLLPSTAIYDRPIVSIHHVGDR